MSTEGSMDPIPTDPEMTLDTAVDLAENYRAKVVVPFDKLAAVLRLVRDSQHLVAANRQEVAELDGRLAALRIEEVAAGARVANATARAEDAELESAQAVQKAEGMAADAQGQAARAIAAADEDARAHRDTLEADHRARMATLTGLRATAQQQLDAVTAEYEALVAVIRAKFGGP
jgi:hypothetical protein